MYAAVRLTRNRRANGVDNTDAERTPLKAVLQRKDRIGRFTGLREEHTNIITEDGRLAVQKVARKLDAHGNLGELLEDGACGNARVVARPACNEHNATASAHDGEVRTQAAQGDLVRVEVDTSTHSVNNRLRLLVDFLLHEMVKLALHDLRKLEFERLN
jgi:hypothetical protein